jgi:tRNA pseudouridine38-40 synthase
VRIMVGTLVSAGRGDLDAAGISALLAAGDRTRSGVTAPAHGLTMVRVIY